MKPEDIELNSINGSFEFEKISREIDTIGDLDTCKAMLKAYVKDFTSNNAKPLLLLLK